MAYIWKTPMTTNDKEKYFHAMKGQQLQIERLRAEIEVYKDQLNNICEIYAGMDGLGPDQVQEPHATKYNLYQVKYLMRIITQMYIEAAK
jgi:hypothetical protein